MYTDPNFDNDKISYGFLTRKDGVSAGLYAGLNCGFGSDDIPENVSENRKRAALKIGADPDKLLGPYQIHSADVVTINKSFTERPKADALVTNRANLALSVLTADCAPVLFYGDGVIGAAHAGWKGALYGVLDNTINAMRALGAENISACVGPCIGLQSYEVSQDFKNTVISYNKDSEQFFNSKNHFNLPEYCKWRLKSAGVHSVTVINKDTYTNEAEFYSYRRTTHRGESDYGRQISAIMLKS